MTYTTEEMTELWSDETTLSLWAHVETAILRAQYEIGLVPREWYEKADFTPPPSVEAWREETEITGHELVSFLMLWDECGVQNVHIGVTSSDITDTALAIRVKGATQTITESLQALLEVIDELDSEVGPAVRLGRTHGQPAVLMTHHDLFERWRGFIGRSQYRLGQTGHAASMAKISGPVGTYQQIDRRVEIEVCEMLGLRRSYGSSQIVQRDNLAAWVAELGTTATNLDAIATELRLMAHASIAEATDDAGSTSSAMPHKTNPNRLERLTGLARIVRSAYEPIASGVVQWHERDMAHSSVERTLLPQITGIVHYMATSLERILSETRFNTGNAASAAWLAEPETLTHAMMTHLQLKGTPYAEARAVVSHLYSTNITASSLKVALNNHPQFKDFTPPKVNTIEEAINGIL